MMQVSFKKHHYDSYSYIGHCMQLGICYNIIVGGSNHSMYCFHVFINFSDNFHLAHQGGTVTQPHYHIQRYNDQDEILKLQAASGSSTCIQSIPTSSAGTIWVAELGDDGDSLSGIKLSTTTSTGDKWYLRADPFANSAHLACPNHINDVSVMLAI